MVSTRKKRQSNRRLFSHLDDFDQDITIGNTVSDRQKNATVNAGTGYQDFTVGTSENNLMFNENTLKVITLEKCFNERIDREMKKIIQTVEDRIQNAILTAINKINANKNELVVGSINAFSRWRMASTRTESERE